MRRPILGAVTLACVAATLAACGSSNDNNPLATGSASGGGGGNAAITLYTSQPDTDVAAMVKAFNEKNPDIKVNVFRSGTEEVISKIEAEKQAGATGADVIFIADALSMEKLKGDQVLAQYESPEGSDVPSQYVDPDHYYTGTKIISTGIAINTDKVKTDPTSWNVLTSADAKGTAEMPSPLYSGAAAYNVALFADDRRSAGTTGRSWPTTA